MFFSRQWEQQIIITEFYMEEYASAIEAGEYLNPIMAILVCYQQRIETAETLLSLSRSLGSMKSRLDLVIYDNSRTPMLNSRASVPKEFNVTYLHDPSNPGVSKSYNKGAAI